MLFPAFVLLQCVIFQYLGIWYGAERHVVGKRTLLDIKRMVCPGVGIHAPGSLGQRGVPTPEILEAEALEAQFQSSLVAYELAHLVFVVLTLLEIGVFLTFGQASSFAYGLYHVVCRVFMPASAGGPVGLVGCLGVVEENLGVSHTWYVMRLFHV